MPQKSLEKSKSKDDIKRSPDSKRGIFTSKYQQKPNAYVYLQSSLPGFNRSHEQLGHTTFIKSNEYLKIPHHNIHMGGTNIREEIIHKTPPPQVRFNYLNGSREGSPIKYVPISRPQSIGHEQITNRYYPNGQQQNSIAYYPQQNVQIRKTFIPQHIYNYVGQQQPLQQSKIKPPQNPPQTTHTDEAYNLLLRQYQKLFGKFESQCTHTKQLQIIIEQLRRQISKNPPTKNIETHHREKNQNYSLNIQLLHDKIYAYYEKYIDGILRARKQKCIDRLSKVFQSAQQQINVTVIEESSSHKWTN